MHNQEILDKLKDKWIAISEYEALMKGKVDALKHVKAQPMICNKYKMITSIMTFSDTYAANIKIHIKSSNRSNNKNITSNSNNVF